MTNTVVVITGAAPLSKRGLDAVSADAVLIAADGGLDHALAAGLEPAVLVGDLDSVSPGALAWAHEHAEVVRHPPDKDETDTELALVHGASLQPQRILLLAGQGDRMDHAIAALGALGGPTLAPVPQLDAWWGDDELRVVHGPGKTLLEHPTGTTFSVLAMHGPCRGVTLDGARWPLRDHDLAPMVGLGVSNEIAASPASASVTSGVLTVIIPGGAA